MRNRIVSLLLLAFPTLVFGGPVLTYQLLSDSTITPLNGASQSLSGNFSWTPIIPSQVVDSDAFATTALDFTGGIYTLTLANNPRAWSSTTQTGPFGQTQLNVDVDFLTPLDQGLFTISGFGSGSYVGSPSAPTEVIFNFEGVAPGSGGALEADLYIHAALVPEQPSYVVTAFLPFLLGLCCYVKARQRERSARGQVTAL